MNPIFKVYNFPWRWFGFALIAALMLFLAVNMADGAELNRIKFLDAIVTVENTPRYGRNGELGPYQFTRATWYQHSNKLFVLPIVRSGEGERVAEAHLSWLIKHVDNPTPYRLALAWNGGLGSVQRNTFKDSTVDYAVRVFNVYEEATK